MSYPPHDGLNEGADSLPPLETIPQPIPPRRSPIRRVGCAVLLVIWFAVLLLPCLFGLLLTRGEITFNTGSAPNQMTRIWLISEASERGIGLSTASVYPANSEYELNASLNNALCVQTDVRYLLWAGRAEPVRYCECYTRSASDQPWEFTEAIEATCPVTLEAQP